MSLAVNDADAPAGTHATAYPVPMPAETEDVAVHHIDGALCGSVPAAATPATLAIVVEALAPNPETEALADLSGLRPEAVGPAGTPVGTRVGAAVATVGTDCGTAVVRAGTGVAAAVVADRTGVGTAATAAGTGSVAIPNVSPTTITESIAVGRTPRGF